MRHLATQRMFFQPQQDWSGEAPAFDPAHLLLLGIERALAPPIVHLRSTFQPLRVVIVGTGPMCDDAAVNETEFGLPRALPQTSAMPAHAQSQFHQRAVNGEVLVDEEGRLYEKIGCRIRPIHQLASGASGELIELVPIVHPGLRLLGPSGSPKIVQQQERLDNALVARDKAADVQREGANKFIPVQSPENAKSSGYRKLFADPGQWRVVWWGDFKEVLTKQLAHPDRLKETYRLPCYVQVIEVERSLTIEELAASLNGEKSRDKALYFLTDEIASKLDLLTLLPPVPASSMQRTANTLSPHDRLFRLVVANDPTADVVTNAPKSQPNLSAPNSLADTTAEKPQAKREIPVRFLKEREFLISREEALYDMALEKSFRSRLRQLMAKLRVFKRRDELQKWKAMIAGKSLEEQLWHVRPPKILLTDLRLRDWVGQILTNAGYDTEWMLFEWEVFWRRKGLS